MLFDSKAAREARIRKLAHRIEELRLKDVEVQQLRQQILEARRKAVQRLWETCRSFASQLNAFAAEDKLDLSPSEPPADCRDEQPIELMLNVRGRVLLVALRAPANLISSDNFRKAYILEGDVRFFNQELLESDRVEEHSVFFCPGEGQDGDWLFWNVRTYKSGLVDEDYFASLLEQIL